MKTITNNKRRVKHSLKHRAQRKYKTHKNKHAKTQLKQYKTHRGGSASVPQSEFDIRSIDITSHNINDFINAYTNSNASPNNFCKRIQFNDINDNTLINNAINIITTQFTQLYTLVIVNCNITVLPESIGNLTQLTTLGVLSCYALTKLPDSIGNLTALTTLELRGCEDLKTLPDSIGNLTALKTLILTFCEALKTLPDSIGNLTVLETLDLHGCSALETLPYSIGNLTVLETLDLTSCYALTKLPDSIGNLTALTTLELRGCEDLKTLPDSIGNLTALKTLILTFCEALKTLPDSIGNLTVLETLGLFACAALTHLPKSFWLLLNLRTITYTYNDTIKNPEILYLMPQITLSEDVNTKYLNKIKNDTNPESMYKIPIKKFLMPFTEYNFKHYAPQEQNELFSTLALGQQKQTLGVDYADDIQQVFESTYINKIPYGLNGEQSIQEQIDVFTNLRTQHDSIQAW